MVTLELNGKHLYIDGYLKKNLDYCKSLQNKDWDFCLLVDGRERTGKSALAQQGAFYLDPTLTIDRITFNPEEFKSAVKKAEKYQAIIYDEAHGGLNSASTLTEISKSIVSMMTEIGQKNLYVFIVLPTYFDLNKYVSIFRSEFLLHVYTGNSRERGYFSFYNYERKKKMWLNGKKEYLYCMPPNFRGRFTKGYMVDEDQYRKKKATAFLEEEEAVKPATIQRDALVKYFNEQGFTFDQICSAMNKYSLGSTMPSLLRDRVSKLNKRLEQIQKSKEGYKDVD